MTKLARIHYIELINQNNTTIILQNQPKQHKAFWQVVADIVSFKFLFVCLIHFYKSCISPLLPHSCMFVPSCSSYMLDAIKHYGVIGVYMGVERILRCNPLNVGGVDPVPDNPRGMIKWLY